jgi:serine O-acetyltransferase
MSDTTVETMEQAATTQTTDRAPAGPPPTFWETLLADIEWSGGPVDVDDDQNVDEWKGRKLELGRLVNCLQIPGFYSTLFYRLSRWTYLQGMNFVAAPLQIINSTLTGADISRKADLGPGLRIGHPYGLFIGPDVKVGVRSTFNQGTCLSSNMEMDDGAPDVGNYLYMSPGGKVFGAVKIGHRVWIGPNSVALKDIEDDKVVLGVPGRAMPPSFRQKQPR